MKTLFRCLSLLWIACVLLPLAGCAQRTYTITVYNWGDFIDETLLDEFTEFYRERDPAFGGIRYETCDTPETMYTKLVKSGEPWDVACNSDYLEGRLLREGHLQPFPTESMPNYTANVSEFSKAQYRTIQENAMEGVSDPDYDPDAVYGISFMWGTMGIAYNVEDVLRAGDPEELFADWGIMWNEAFDHRTYMKNSVRESYIVGTLYANTETLSESLRQMKAGTITAEEYNRRLSEILNVVDEQSAESAKTALLNQQQAVSVKYDVDYDKIALATGQASLDYCWAGDGFKAIRMGAEETPRVILSYDIPDTGTNLFFDGWFLNGKLKADSPEYRAATAFVDYLCTPEAAQRNMDEIGYVSSVAGLTMIEWGAENWKAATQGETQFVFDESLIARAENQDLSYFFRQEDLDAYEEAYGHAPVLNPVQYPSRDEMYKLATVRTYSDEQNDLLLDMWAQVKTGDFPLTQFLIFAAIIAVLLVLLVIRLVRKFKKRAVSAPKRFRRAYPRVR